MRKERIGLIAAGLAGCLAAAQLHAQDAPSSWGVRRDVPAADAATVQALITDQIAALRRGDAGAAYAAASPSIHRRFPTAAAFMDMAAANYGPLFGKQQIQFGSLRSAAATPTQGDTFSQSVDLGEGSGAATAVFGLERQPGGRIRITSCVLIERRPGSV